MADLVKELVTGIVDSVLKEILKKTTGRAAGKRKKRQTRSPSTGRFGRKTSTAAKKPARKQVSKRRTATGRSKQRRS